ncbi:kelch domain-containing protein 9-like [Mobula hypostoma]|uniref:kelch domain-containing protein 9-like n=1 Tax=Mobula hypostoma TaxID=723540 RepID=UPI002FC2E9F6
MGRVWCGEGGAGAEGPGALQCPEVRWSWKKTGSSALLARAFHSVDLVGDRLVVYGGMRSAEPREGPLGDAVILGAGSLAVERVVSGGPARSHHGTAVLQERWLLVVGGWDGKRRLAGLQALDLAGYETEPGFWSQLKQEQHSQAPVGLSGHSVTKLSEQRLWVVGREGGVRTQRRFASIFQLQVDMQHGCYRYEEQASRTASRSGHSATLCRRGCRGKATFQLLLFGGRNTPGFEVAGHWKEGVVKSQQPSPQGLVGKFSSLIADEVVTPGSPTPRRHHSTVQVGPFTLLHGGESFNKAIDTICSDLYIYDTRSCAGQWFRFPASDVELKRVGHRMVVLGEQLCVIGGLGPGGKHCPPDIYTLDLHC